MTRGFSLLELMLVVAITGIVAALALPPLANAVKKERARLETSKVVAAVEQARNRARVQVCTTHVTVSVAAATLRVAPDPTDADIPCRSMPTKLVAFDPGLITLSAFTVGGAVTNPLVFNDEGGLSSPTARARLAIAPAIGQPRLVEVWPATGTVRLLP